MTRNEHLRKYMEYGWTIIPVKKGTKMPAVNWKEYQTRKPTKEELRKWFEDPEVGVGLVTGKQSGVIVVDEDSYKEKGFALKLETPLVVRTGGGGKHFYFKYQDGITNSANEEKAVDVRGEGGFVVLPPTLHPTTGKAYEWNDVLPANLEDLPTLDQSVAEQIVKTKSSEPIQLSAYINVSEGGRNDSLHRVACSFLNKYNPAEAMEFVMMANRSYSPPLSDAEVSTIFKSALEFVNTHPKEKLKEPERTPLEIMSFKQADEMYDKLMAKYGDGVTTGYKTLDDYFKFIPQQLYVLSASTHVGKTTLAMNMAGRCAKAGFNVVFASLEQGVFIIPRLKSMFGEGLSVNTNVEKNMFFIAPNDLPKPNDFTETFKDAGSRPKLLIVDHLHYFQRGNRGATEEMDRLVVEMQVLAKNLEIPVVVIAHVRKLKDDKPPSMDDLKDSSSLSQIPAVVAMMHREKNSQEIVATGGRIYSNEGQLLILKNRIFGKTGMEKFTLLDTGEILFNREPQDKINPVAEEVLGLEGFFDES